MILAVLALVLLGVVFGWRRLGKALGRSLRGAAGVWRPTAGLGALVALLASLALFVREDWWVAIALALLSAVLAVGARKRRRPAAAAAPSGRMSHAEARAILGLEPDAGPDAIQAAYRRLIRFAHPDQGGTRGLAAQLNLARDVLMGR